MIVWILWTKASSVRNPQQIDSQMNESWHLWLTYINYNKLHIWVHCWWSINKILHRWIHNTRSVHIASDVLHGRPKYGKYTLETSIIKTSTGQFSRVAWIIIGVNSRTFGGIQRRSDVMQIIRVTMNFSLKCAYITTS